MMLIPGIILFGLFSVFITIEKIDHLFFNIIDSGMSIWQILIPEYYNYFRFSKVIKRKKEKDFGNKSSRIAT